MFCRSCGQQLPDNSLFCSKCGKSTGTVQTVVNRPVQPAGQTTVSDVFFPKSASALTAYYMGIFSLFMPLLAFPAIICAIIALSSANKFTAGKGSVIAHALIGLIFSILVLVIWGFVVFALIIP